MQKFQKLLVTSTILAAALGLSACQSPTTTTTANNSNPVLKSDIRLFDQNQTKLGEMYLRPVNGGIQVYGKLTGLNPGKTVAVHIHETGSCKNMGKAAGGHFNPYNKPHGNPSSPESHAGDLPNVTADANGVATMNFVKKGISVAMTGENSVYRRAFIVHSGADDYISQPAGNAGERIACGIIEKY